MGRRYTITDEQIAQVRERLCRGESRKLIAATVGVSFGTVLDILYGRFRQRDKKTVKCRFKNLPRPKDLPVPLPENISLDLRDDDLKRYLELVKNRS